MEPCGFLHQNVSCRILSPSIITLIELRGSLAISWVFGPVPSRSGVHLTSTKSLFLDVTKHISLPAQNQARDDVLQAIYQCIFTIGISSGRRSPTPKLTLSTINKPLPPFFAPYTFQKIAQN